MYIHTTYYILYILYYIYTYIYIYIYKQINKPAVRPPEDQRGGSAAAGLAAHRISDAVIIIMYTYNVHSHRP